MTRPDARLKLDMASNVLAAECQHIPSFFDKDADDGSFGSKVREEVRGAFLQSKSVELLNNQELQELWVLLEKSVSPEQPGQQPSMNYADFKRVANLTGNPKTRRFFSPITFAKLLQSSNEQKITIVSFFNYVMKKVWIQQTRIGLSLYDITGAGYLRETDFETYIKDLIPTLPQLKNFDENLHPFYVCVASRKFFFFLDPTRSGRIKLTDVLESSFLDDLVVELRDEKTSEESNWFSTANATRLYNQYIKLDEDQNGMLSREELAKFGGGSYPKILLDQIFEVYTTYDNEIDFKTYIDFCLAVDYKREPQSVHYFFKLLTNLNGRNYVDNFVLYQIFKANLEIASSNGQDLNCSFRDVADEIHDLVKPVSPGKIALADLINSQADIISILTDFWDTKEALAINANETDV